jgi:uncharacterized protein
VDDRKLSPETCENLDHARTFLHREGVPSDRIEWILHGIRQISFKGSDSVSPDSIEAKCVQDADRLDAIGAIGIARAFAYGGNHNRVMYDPDEPPTMNMSREEYHNHKSTTVNHFYEKLFLLTDMMSTPTAKRIARDRDEYMRGFISQFLAEWDAAE